MPETVRPQGKLLAGGVADTEPKKLGHLRHRGWRRKDDTHNT
jgi:hypothetical protein